MKTRRPPVPAERSETLRQSIMDLLRQNPTSVFQISEEVGIAEKNVYEHLEHIRRSLQRDKTSLNILPPQCQNCGFVFKKRQRLKKPGRCPICRSESISRPRYQIE